MEDEEELSELEQMNGIYYVPCKLCGSMEYDQGNHNEIRLEQENVFEPESCDICNFGFVRGSGLTLH